MFLNRRRCATLKADSPASVLMLDYRRFKHFLLAFPETVFALFEKCVHQLDKQQSKTVRKSVPRSNEGGAALCPGQTAGSAKCRNKVSRKQNSQRMGRRLPRELRERSPSYASGN